DDAGGRELERQLVDQQRVAVALLQARGLDDDVSEPRSRRDVDLDVLELLPALLGEHLLVRLQSRLALRLARARGEPHPLQLALERLLPRALRLLLLLEPIALLLEPARVVALPRDAFTAVQLEDPAGDVVEEVAIVRDRDDRAFV